MSLEAQIPGSSLPAELLLETFRYLSLPDRVSARAVCRAWHDAADGCPVTVPIEELNTAQLVCYLDQLRAAPLLYDGIVDIDGSETHYVELANVVAEHIDHTVILSIQIHCGSDVPEELRAAVEQPAPTLERVRLEFSVRTSIEDLRLFGHCAPRLTYCAVHMCSDIIPAISPFKTIRTLVLHGLILYEDVDLMFREFPVLEELSLDFDVLYYDDEDDEADDTTPPPLPPPSSLKRLTIAAESGDAAELEPRIAWLRHERIGMVSFRHDQVNEQDGWPLPDTVHRMLELLALPAAESLVVSCAPAECALRLVAPDGRERVHAGIPRDTLADVLKTMPLDVTDLVVAGVHALYEPDTGPPPPYRFAALRTFTLILRQLSPQSEHMSASLRIPPVWCPALESVTLAITQKDYNRVGSVRLSTEDVRAFLCDTLPKHTRGKLKTLCLRGVSVEDVTVLRSLAEKIIEHAHEPLMGFVFPEDDLRRFDEDDLLSS